MCLIGYTVWQSAQYVHIYTCIYLTGHAVWQGVQYVHIYICLITPIVSLPFTAILDIDNEYLIYKALYPSVFWIWMRPSLTTDCVFIAVPEQK